MTYPRVVRAVIHVESKVLDEEEEAGFFLDVGDGCVDLAKSILVDKVEIIDQVIVKKKKHPTEDANTKKGRH